MKPSSYSLTRLLATAAVGAACAVAVPQAAQADPPWERDRDRHSSWDRDRDRDRHGWNRDSDRRRSFYAVPRSRFVITFGNGYAGRGYYYGPPGMPYYYDAPGVRFYRSRSLVPGHYWGTRGPQNVIVRGSLDARVQTELARRGYYRGPIDGDIGPGSRAAIVRFQADRGLPVTGSINSSLLSALGLY